MWKNITGLFWYTTNTDHGGLVTDVATYEFAFQQDFNNDGFITQIGTAGNDKLGGKSPNELLTGGAGVDTFVLKANSGGVTKIADFESAEFLDVSSFGLASLNLLTVTGAGTPNGNALNQFIFNSDNGELYFDADRMLIV